MGSNFEEVVLVEELPRRIVHGTPITPAALLDQLRGWSFCISYADGRQVDRCIELVGSKGMLLLDNGAFTFWKRWACEIHREDFWEWANEIQQRCDVAVAVIPDVIEGDEQENLEEASWAVREELSQFPERIMPVWHTNDSQRLLMRYLRLFNFVGIGSSWEFDAVNEPREYLELMERVGDVVKAVYQVYGRRPWVHLMRGIQHLGSVPWAESADSCNLARNHHQFREVPNHVGQMASAIAKKVVAMEQRKKVKQGELFK